LRYLKNTPKNTVKMKLNDCQIRNAKLTEAGKKAKLFDGGGLYLEVASQAAKSSA
jgi:hypothetical protein